MRVIVLASLLLCLCFSLSSAAVLTGTVVDQGGQPVAGAKLWLYRFALGAPKPELALKASGVSGADGKFSLEDPAPDPLSGNDTWRIYALKPGLSLVEHIATDAGSTIRLILMPPAPLSGIVQTVDGKPIPGASLYPAYLRAPDSVPRGGLTSLPKEVAPEVTAKTDAAGQWRLAAAPAGWIRSLRLVAEGYGDLTVSAPNQAFAGAVPPITLLAPGTIRGKVVCPQQPDLVKNLSLDLSGGPAVRIPDQPMYWSASAKATTDAQGAFVVNDLPPGKWCLSVEALQNQPYQLRRVWTEVQAGKETALDLAAEQAATVRGRIVAADTGVGLPGASVYLSAQQDGREAYSIRVKSANDGGFEALALPAKVYLQVYGVEGYLGTRWDRQPQADVTAAGAVIPDIKLSPARQIVVQVADRDGRPVQGANVFLDLKNADIPFIGGQPRGTTDAQGQCVVKGLEETVGTLYARKDDLASATVTVNTGEQREPMKLVLMPGQAVAANLRVLDQDGRPVADARVTLNENRDMSARVIQCTPPDADGRIRQTGLQPALKYQFHVEAPACFPKDSDAWTAVAGETHDFGTLTMTRQKGFLAGLVVDEAGKPVAGAKVSNVCDAPTPAITTTDATGRFRLEGLVAGDAYAFVEAARFRFAAGRAPCGTTDLKIVLAPLGEVKLGQPVPLAKSVLPDAEARALARELLLEALKRTGAAARGRGALITELAKIDPQAAYDAAGENKEYLSRAHVEVGKSLLPKDATEAIAVMRQAADPRYYTQDLIAFAGKQLRPNPKLARQCLDAVGEVLLQVPSIEWRAMLQAQVGELLIELDPAAGRPLLRDAMQQAATFALTDSAGAYRGEIAACGATTDLAASLALVQPLAKDSDRVRHLTNIARRLARTNPDKAIELVKASTSSWDVNQGMATIVPFFPRDQFVRAHDLANGIQDGFFRGYALARLCQVAPPDQVPMLLNEAQAAVLAQSARYGGSMQSEREPQSLARLACIGRQMGYPYYGDIALRAASIRVRGAGNARAAYYNVTGDFSLARMLAFTDRALARHLLDAAVEYAGGTTAMKPDLYYSAVAAAGELDPKWAVEMLKAMPPDDPAIQGPGYAETVAALVRRLVDSPESREHAILADDYQWNWLAEDVDH